MTDNETEIPSPEICASEIFEICGTKFEPDIAADLWPKILQHKWLMSEKLHRDVGLKTACTDFLENYGAGPEGIHGLQEKRYPD